MKAVLILSSVERMPHGLESPETEKLVDDDLESIY